MFLNTDVFRRSPTIYAFMIVVDLVRGVMLTIKPKFALVEIIDGDYSRLNKLLNCSNSKDLTGATTCKMVRTLVGNVTISDRGLL